MKKSPLFGMAAGAMSCALLQLYFQGVGLESLTYFALAATFGLLALFWGWKLLASVVGIAAITAAVVPGLTTRQVISDPGGVATAVADSGLAEAGGAVSSAAEAIPDVQVPESVDIVPSIGGTEATTPPPESPDQ